MTQNPSVPASDRLSFSTKLAYGAGDLGTAITANILVFYVLFFFTNVAGLPPGLAASVLTIGKISDAINDPIIGVMTDRTRSPLGRRYPWMLAGALPFGLFFFLVWIVPQFSADPTTNQWLLFGYYVLIGILFHLAYTTVNLPYIALTPNSPRTITNARSSIAFALPFPLAAVFYRFCWSLPLVPSPPMTCSIATGLSAAFVHVLQFCRFSGAFSARSIAGCDRGMPPPSFPPRRFSSSLRSPSATDRFCMSLASIYAPGWRCR